MVISAVLKSGWSAWVRLHVNAGQNTSGFVNAPFMDSLLTTNKHPEAQTTF